MQRALRIAVIGSLFVGGFACNAKMPGGPLVVEMPEAGASVDLSGWLFLDEDPEGKIHGQPVLEPIEPGRMRLRTQKSSVDVRFLAGKLPYPHVRLHAKPPRPPKREPWTLDACAAFFKEPRTYETVAWSAGEPESTVVNGIEARIIPIDSTESGAVTEQRARVLAFATEAGCYGVEVVATRTLWSKQEKMLAKVLASVRPL